MKKEAIDCECLEWRNTEYRTVPGMHSPTCQHFDGQWFESALLRNNLNRIENYAIYGLTSIMLAQGYWGCVRLFHMEREQLTLIAPHSHRYHHQAKVLRGSVENTLWEYGTGDLFQESVLKYGGSPGKYEKTPAELCHYTATMSSYVAGESYMMRAEQIHSIKFSRGAVVLISEGPSDFTDSLVLDPVLRNVSDDQHVDVFTDLSSVQPWMFQS
jgi:hypothetical protein